MKFKQAALLFVVSLSTTPAIANQDDKRQFEQDYAAFQTAYQNSENNVTLKSLAQQAYLSGEAYFGEQSLNTANLKLSYLNLLDNLSLRERSAQLLAKEVLYSYQTHYQNDDAALATPLLMVLDTMDYSSDLDDALSIYESVEALVAANQRERPAEMFEVHVRAAAAMLRLGSRVSRDLITLAEQGEKQFGATHRLTLLANFHAGRYFEAAAKTDEALQSFSKLANQALESLAPELHHPKYMSHARLVALLAERGEHDLATKHCLAISHMGLGIQDEQDPKPLYRVAPEYPRSFTYNGVEGITKVRYDIDDVGRVQNIEIIESKHQRFSDAVIEAMQQWRFAPRIEAGETVVTKARVTQFNFALD